MNIMTVPEYRQYDIHNVFNDDAKALKKAIKKCGIGKFVTVGCPDLEVVKSSFCSGKKICDEEYIYMIPTDIIMRYKKHRSKKRFLPSFWVDKELGRKLSGAEKYKYLFDSMQTHGWDDRQPLCIRITKKSIKVNNGNHRLIIADELGVEKIPVCIIYR